MKFVLINMAALAALLHGAWAEEGGLRVSTNCMPAAVQADHPQGRQLNVAPPSTLYGPDKTGAVKNWKEAVQFCKDNGQTLATKAAICKDGTVTFGSKSGDQWAPYMDSPNGWIQVGVGPHPVCTDHNALGSSPAWGADTDTGKESYEANYILCVAQQPAGNSATYADDINGFLVVAGNKVVGSFTSLDKAKQELDKYTTGSRLIAEIFEGNVVNDPHKIRGEDQLKANGFNQQWQDWEDIKKMIATAKQYVLMAQAQGSGQTSTGVQVARPVTQQMVFQKCRAPYTQKGIVPDALDPIAKCYSALESPVEIASALIKELIKHLGENDAVDDIVQKVFVPLEKIGKKLLKKGVAKVGLGGISASACAGDFKVDIIKGGKDHMVGICGNLPLGNDTEWSVIAGELTLPAEITAAACGGTPGALEFSFCAAVSFCDVMPSMAFIANHGLATCLTAQTGAATAGVGTVVAALMQAGLDTYGFGLSLTNAFEFEVPLFNGIKMIDGFVANPTIFDRISLGIGAEKIHPALKGWFEIKGVSNRGISVFLNGQPTNEADATKGIMAFDAKNPSQDLVQVFKGMSVSVEAVIQGKINMLVNFELIPVIGKFLRKVDYEIAHAATFITTGEKQMINSDGQKEIVYPGMSTFIGRSADQAVLGEIIKKILNVFGGAMKLANHFGVASFDVEEIVKKMHLEDLDKKQYYGLALSVNAKYAGFRLCLPVAKIDLIFQCSTDISNAANPKLSCHIKTETDRFFQFVKDQALWLFQVLDKEAKNGVKTIAAAAERAGAMAQEVFSEENVKNTITDILQGKYDAEDAIEDLKKIAAIGYTLFTFCEGNSTAGNNPNCWPDATMCFGDPAQIKKKIGTCCNCCNDESWWKGNVNIAGKKDVVYSTGAFACGTEPKWGDGTLCRIDPIFNNCGQCERPATWWMSVPITTIPGTNHKINAGLPGWACGTEPCWPDESKCVAGISCHKCCSGKNMFARCGKQGCWNDGTVCAPGTSCHDCCNPSTWWHGPPGNKPPSNACGVEPKWPKGTVCLQGTSCNQCAEASTWWRGKVAFACGKEPCWGAGTPCFDCQGCCKPGFLKCN